MVAPGPWRELLNRWSVYLEVRLRGLGRRFRPQDLVAEIERIERRDRFAALWGIENLGYRYAESERRRGADPLRLFDPVRVGELPARALPMLHAGVGLSLARRALAGAAESADPSADLFPPESADPSGGSPKSPALTGFSESADPSPEPFARGDGRAESGHGAAAVRVARLLHELSHPGHWTAAVECLGLITRFFHPLRLPEVATRLAFDAPEVVAPFWHGVGRCHYFLPAEMLPRRGHWGRMLDRLEAEAPPGAARANAMAGWVWALVLVNQRHPAVVEQFLERHGSRLAADSAGGRGNEGRPRDAFASGVAAACAVRELTSPRHPVTGSFLAHRPGDPATAEAWREVVAEPGRWGIEVLLPRLASAGLVSELCRYHPPLRPGDRRSA